MSDRRPSGVKRSPRRHPVGGPVRDPGPDRRTNQRWIALLVLLAAVFAALRGVHALADQPDPSAVFTEQVVVVGVTGRPVLTDADRTVLGAHTGDAQVGMMSVRPRYVGDCAAAGWTTLGAGRRAAVGGLCAPAVTGGAVVDWSARVAAAAARRGDATPGTLAGSVAGCVTAVGPGAALAAATPDGRVPRYRTAPEFLDGGLRLDCPTTLVDAGDRSDEVISRLAARRDLTVIVTGVGPATGSDDPALQVVYRLGTTLPGWLTSASTRREGIVTLTDLTRTLVDHDPVPGAGPPVAVDGSPFQVYPDTVTVAATERAEAAVAALSDAAPLGYLFLGGLGTAMGAVLVVATLRRRYRLAQSVLTLGACLTAAMMLTGSVPWARLDPPAVFLGLAVAGWLAVLGGASVGLARLLRVPALVAAHALTVAAFTVDAALGGPMQPGSMLNSRPVFGLRWYGFGNVTFAAYASAGLLLAGYVAHRQILAGRRRAAVAAVAAIGFGVVVCEGWPSMGTDFGGVIALTPPLVWLLLVLAGVRITPLRLLAVGGSAVLAIAAISLLDWRRGPDRRSHLGNFVQRIIDGDALDVVARKAVASAGTIASPLGVGTLLLGTACWVLILRWALPRLQDGYGTLRPALLAVLATGALGTLLNDGGISVLLTATGVAAIAVGWLLVGAAADAGRTAPGPRAARR